MTKRKLVSVALAAVLLAGAAFAYWHWTRTPTYSLRQMQKALETHDVAKFEKYVDVKCVSSRLIDDMMIEALKESQSQSGAEALGTALGAGLVQLMKPRLVGAVHEQFIRLVERGSFRSSTPATSESASEESSLRSMSEQIGADDGSFKGIEYIKKQGKIALVGLEFRNAELDADLVLELKLRDMGGYWQLVEFANLTELLQKTKGLQEVKDDPMGKRLISPENAKHSFQRNETEGQLLIITGLARNHYKTPRSFLRLKGLLHDSQGKVLAQQVVYCGNVFSEDDLRTLPMDEISKRFKVRGGDKGVNMKVSPSKSVPFMIVFNNIPAELAEYTIEAFGSEPAE